MCLYFFYGPPDQLSHVPESSTTNTAKQNHDCEILLFCLSRKVRKLESSQNGCQSSKVIVFGTHSEFEAALLASLIFFLFEFINSQSS